MQNYPRKPVKKAPRVEKTLTCIVQRQRGQETEYLLTQRPSKGKTHEFESDKFLLEIIPVCFSSAGLLAGMWELPSMVLESDLSENKHGDLLCTMMQRFLDTSLGTDSFQFVGEVSILGFR